MQSLRSSRGFAVVLVTFAAFVDLVAYSIAIPILPHLSIRHGASPTVIGLLFSSFGLSLLLVSIPMGAVSDRVGRKLPMMAGLIALSGASVLFAFSETMPWLFAARFVQGAADAATWVVGFALLADLYGRVDRGRVMGLVMSGSTFGLMIGPPLGGWLYERGGPRVPFVAVAVLAAIGAFGFLWLRLPADRAAREVVPLHLVLREPAVLLCALVVTVSASTIAMLEPVVSLWLASSLDLTPARIGLVFGTAAVAATVLHPVYGHLADRRGSRQMTMIGLLLTALMLPLLSRAWSFESAALLYLLQGAAIAMVITPSLAYMAEATAAAGAGAFGVAYGLYNFAWGAGLLVGPAVGGFLYERVGFDRLVLAWMPLVVVVTLLLARQARRDA